MEKNSKVWLIVLFGKLFGKYEYGKFPEYKEVKKRDPY